LKRKKKGKEIIMNQMKISYCIFYSNEEKVRKMEKVIIDLMDESCFAYEKNDNKLVRKSTSLIRSMILFI
jgi:hypothetical protein